MTNERAIELLRRLQNEQFDGIHGDERREALEMAVRALFSQQIVNDSQGLVNDCISRKMAIDEVKRLHDVAWANWKETRISANTMIDALKDLPSAQPETHDKRTETHACDLINRQQAIDAHCELCSDKYICCPVRNGNICKDIEAFRMIPSTQPQRILYANMSDAEFEKWLYEHGICNPNIHESIPCYAVPLLIDNAISELPSAQPERKRGRWIEKEYSPFYCSVCGTYQYSASWEIKNKEYNFCPRCGARMDGGVSDE